MQTLLIVGDKEEGKKEALKICRNFKIDDFDISTCPGEENSIGISEVRNLQKKLFLKPFQGETKALILENAEKLTLEAQNALLKILEEPPANTLILLTTQNKDLMLPTILSRCKTILLKKDTFAFSKEEKEECLNKLESLLSEGVGDKLKLAQDLAKNKEEAILFLKKMILVVRELLVDRYHDLNHDNKKGLESKYLDILTSLQKTHKILSVTNANPRLTLENLFLNL